MSTLLPFVGSVLIAPLVMLLIGKQLKIKSKNLNFGRLLFISLIAGFLGTAGDLVPSIPFASLIIYAGLAAYMLKSQLETNWNKALGMTIGGVVAMFAWNYYLLVQLLPLTI